MRVEIETSIYLTDRCTDSVNCFLNTQGEIAERKERRQQTEQTFRWNGEKNEQTKTVNFAFLNEEHLIETKDHSKINAKRKEKRR